MKNESKKDPSEMPACREKNQAFKTNIFSQSGREKMAKSYRSGWAYAEYAFQYAAAIVVCSLIGYWLDNYFKTGNILMFIGVFIGAAAGFIGLLKSLKVIKPHPNPPQRGGNDRKD